jgi:hypothetical protein
MPRSIGASCGVKITCAGVAADHLLDLGRVAVAARVAHAALGVDDDVVGLEVAAFHERRQRRNRRRRIAAGVRHEISPLDPVAEELGQSVDRLSEPPLIWMLVSMPFDKRRGGIEPVVGAEIHRLRPGGEHLRNDLVAPAVRQAGEDALRPTAELLGGKILERQIEPVHGLQFGQIACPGVLCLGERADLLCALAGLRALAERVAEFLDEIDRGARGRPCRRPPHETVGCPACIPRHTSAPRHRTLRQMARSSA